MINHVSPLGYFAEAMAEYTTTTQQVDDLIGEMRKAKEAALDVERKLAETLSDFGTSSKEPKDSEMIDLLKEKYDMQEHPEGGFFKETYRGEERISSSYGERNSSTAIYFLITPGSVSRLHRIRADEVWHFYLGGPMTIVELVDGAARCTTLGRDVLNDELVQYTVRAGTWFGSFPNEGTAFSFVGCTVAPGFEFQDFELGSRAKLLEGFPDAKDLVLKLTEGLP